MNMFNYKGFEQYLCFISKTHFIALSLVCLCVFIYIYIINVTRFYLIFCNSV